MEPNEKLANSIHATAVLGESSLIGSLSPTFSRVPILREIIPSAMAFRVMEVYRNSMSWCLSQSDISSDRWIDNEVSVGFPQFICNLYVQMYSAIVHG